jgi:hypothetical protein
VSSSADFFLRQTLGEDFFKSLEKVELWKMGTKTVIDHEEMKTALQIVPRTLMAFLIGHLRPMMIGETKEIRIPLEHGQPLLRVSKHEKDVYSGELEDSTEKYTDKKVAEFKFRSIPGIGLVIMSAFELYDIDNLMNEQKSHKVPEPTLDLVQQLIDDCLMMHSLIDKVKENKITERDAIQQLMLAKLSEGLPAERKTTSMENRITRMKERKGEPAPEPKATVNVVNVNISPEIRVENKVKIKGSPLKDFLDGRQKKLHKSEYQITMTKGEDVSCPDCGQHIFNGEVFSGCVCFGDDMDKKVYLAKSESGMKVRFGKGWDPENIEMLLEVLRRKRG